MTAKLSLNFSQSKLFFPSHFLLRDGSTFVHLTQYIVFHRSSLVKGAMHVNDAFVTHFLNVARNFIMFRKENLKVI